MRATELSFFHVCIFLFCIDKIDNNHYKYSIFFIKKDGEKMNKISDYQKTLFSYSVWLFVSINMFVSLFMLPDNTGIFLFLGAALIVLILGLIITICEIVIRKEDFQ